MSYIKVWLAPTYFVCWRWTYVGCWYILRERKNLLWEPTAVLDGMATDVAIICNGSDDV